MRTVGKTLCSSHRRKAFAGDFELGVALQCFDKNVLWYSRLPRPSGTLHLVASLVNLSLDYYSLENRDLGQPCL